MRSYEEMADNILRKYDSYLEKKHRKTVIIKRAAALTLGTAAILGIGIFANALKPPQKPNPEQSGIVVETETTSAKTAYDLIAAGTTATRTTVTKQLETTAVSSVTTTSSESNTTGRKQTTEKAKATTVKTSSATTSLQTMSTVVSETTTMPVNTTTNAGAAVTTTSFPDYEGMVVQNFKKLQPFENSNEYFMINNDIEASKIGEKITETTLAPALFMKSRVLTPHI